MQIVRHALSEPARPIAADAGYDAAAVVAQSVTLGADEGFDALAGRHRDGQVAARGVP